MRVVVRRNAARMWTVGCPCSLHSVGVEFVADFFMWSNAIQFAGILARQHR